MENEENIVIYRECSTDYSLIFSQYAADVCVQQVKYLTDVDCNTDVSSRDVALIYTPLGISRAGYKSRESLLIMNEGFTFQCKTQTKARVYAPS